MVNDLNEAELPLTIENQGVKVEFPPGALAVPELQGTSGDSRGTVEIGAREVTLQEKEAILAAVHPQESSGLFEIGGKMIELTAQVVTTTAAGTVAADKIDEFTEPVAITIDLSGLSLGPEQIAELTAEVYQ